MLNPVYATDRAASFGCPDDAGFEGIKAALNDRIALCLELITKGSVLEPLVNRRLIDPGTTASLLGRRGGQ